MAVINGLIYALSGVMAAGCIARLIMLGLIMAAQPDEKANCIKECKNVLIAFSISLIVGVAPIVQNVLAKYFN